MKIIVFSFFLLMGFNGIAQKLPKLKKDISIKQESINASEFVNKKTITFKNNSTYPLYVINGKAISKQKVYSIAPNTIKKINVLKNKQAINKYGKKGINGVVEIILKTK